MVLAVKSTMMGDVGASHDRFEPLREPSLGLCYLWMTGYARFYVLLMRTYVNDLTSDVKLELILLLANEVVLTDASLWDARGIRTAALFAWLVGRPPPPSMCLAPSCTSASRSLVHPYGLQGEGTAGLRNHSQQAPEDACARGMRVQEKLPGQKQIHELWLQGTASLTSSRS